MSGTHRAIFLDRDGVLNQLVHRDGGFYSPMTYSDFKVFDYVPDVLKTFRNQEFLTIVVTNQPDIAREKLLQSELDQMTNDLLNLGVDHIYICPHDTVDECICRKPLPGLILQAMEDHNINPTGSWMIGDRLTDIEAGEAAGIQSLLIADGTVLDEARFGGPILHGTSLLEASALITRAIA